MVILGINRAHGDASAAILCDGQLVAAAAEERFNRRKHCAGFPRRAIQYCLEAAGVKLTEVDHVAENRNLRANVARRFGFGLSRPWRWRTYVQVLRRRTVGRSLRQLLAEQMELDPRSLRFAEHHVEHHLAHVASAFLCSDFDSAAGLSYDGSGDFVSTMFCRCQGHHIQPIGRIFLPDSLGLFYSSLCQFVGYSKYGDEGKVMALASFGSDRLAEQVEPMVQITPGGFRLNSGYFRPLGSHAGFQIDEQGNITMEQLYGPRLVEMFGPPRSSPGKFDQRDFDIAWAMQRRFEQVFFHLCRLLQRRVGGRRLALAGGCALNSVANGKVFEHTPFERTWIQPAASDDGGALGAALYVYHCLLDRPRSFVMRTASWGPQYADGQIRQALEAAGLGYQQLPRDALLQRTAECIADGQVVGWFQGRMEWGPRALGNRSILAHPGRADMRDILNARVKHREWFRPFAPSVLAERQGRYFEHGHPSPFMLHVFKIRPERRAELCAVNHVDNTGRLQSVARDENPLYYDLIKAFERRTGTAVLLNTSFNENEPIVCRPAEAIDCFLRTRMDALAIGSYLVLKRDNLQVARPEEAV